MIGIGAAWDKKLAGRAMALALVASLVALLVIVTTDDGAPWARRAAMWGAFAPVFGAVGTFGALRLAEARGELLALAAIGARPRRAVIGAVVGGALVALAGPCVAGSRWADQSALFPKPVDARQWRVDEGPSLVEVTMGVRVEPGGRVSFLEESAPPSTPPSTPSSTPPSTPPSTQTTREEANAGLAAALAISLCAIACPIWIAARSSAIRKVIIGLAAVLALIAAFQAVALGSARAGPIALFGAPLLLLADALLPGRAFSRSRA